MRLKKALLAGAAVFAMLLAACSPSEEPAPESSAPVVPAPSPSETTVPRAPTAASAITVHPIATEAAMEVLAEGGTAADAAVAVAAVLSVIEPHFSNIIGGETSALYYNAETGGIESLEAVGSVGSDFSIDGYRARGAGSYGLHQSLVPGAWGGWIELLRAEGTMELERLLEPAIELARDGHPAAASTAEQLRRALNNSPGSVDELARSIYMPGGAPISEGDIIVQSDFADTLEGIVEVYAAEPDRESGLDAAYDHVYTGELGHRLLEASRAGGATFTAEDMENYSPRFEEPLSLEYGEHTVYANPPASQGLMMLVALNILQGADLTAEDADTPEAVHTMIEAVKLAFADREAYIGDPDFTDVPIDELLSPEYGERQLARIDQDSSFSWPIDPGLGENTTTFQIVDHDGNAIAVTTSTGLQFITAGDTGVLMSNRMRYMTADDPDSPNYLEPGKRVRYTGNPYMVVGEDGLRLLGGNIGGDAQSQVQTQQIVAVLDFGLSAPEAIARPRFLSQYHPDSVVPHNARNQVGIENTTPQAVIDGLLQRGQNIWIAAGRDNFGYGTMIEILDLDRGEFSLGTDPRVSTSTGETQEP